MSIKVQNTEDADPFWGFDLLMENEAHVPQTLAEQRQTEDESKKEATTFIQEPEAKGGVIKSSTRGKGKTKEKVAKKEKKVEFNLKPNQLEGASTSDSTGTLSSEVVLNEECYKYEILKKNFERLQHSYLHLKKRFNNLNLHVCESEIVSPKYGIVGGQTTLRRGRKEREGEGAENMEEEEEGEEEEESKKLPKPKRKKTSGGGGGGGGRGGGECEDWAVVYMKL